MLLGAFASYLCTRNLPKQHCSQVNHPQVIRLRSVFMTENSVFLVMDHASGGELLDR